MSAAIPIRRYAVKPGSIANLRLLDDTLPPPAEGEVRVAVRAIGLNFADVFAVKGLYKAAPKTEFTPGLEYAGVVEAVGPGVEALKEGDRVMGVSRFGAYTTHLNTDARYLAPLPADWDFPTGAAYLVQTLTAYYALTVLGAMQPGQIVLVNSGAGGVGLQALKIIKAYNGYAIATLGSESKRAFALAEGYDAVIVRGPSFEADLRAILDKNRLNVVLDSIGGRYFTIPFRLLAPMGRIVVFGAARFSNTGDRPNFLKLAYQFITRPKIDPMALPERNKAVMGFNLIYLYQQVELMHKMLLEMEALRLKPPHVGHTFAFEALPEALRLFQSGKTMGKVVVSLAEI